MEEKILDICETDTRYAADAYFFMNEALAATVDDIVRTEGKPRHLSGAELCNGLKKHSLKQFGPFADLVLDTWGIHATSDFGEIVFNLITVGILAKTPSDRKEDFASVYDFRDAFVAPYLPKSNLRAIRRSVKAMNGSSFSGF